MKHVLLPHETKRPLRFYLAMEEFLAQRDNDDYFFMWQVDPTVIIGRNQSLSTEVNLGYCRSKGIDIVRRKSGGGCVYADHQNIMFSYVTTSPEVIDTFSAYTGLVASFLCSLGLHAEASGRNDIMIGNRKVSGNAFYHRRGRAIVHGTMLFNTDIEEMLRAITPSSTKLSSKGVDSVKSRVTNITDHLDISIDEFKRQAARFICDSDLLLQDADIKEIDNLALDYLKPEWLYGNSPFSSISKSARIDAIGIVTLEIESEGGSIGRIKVSGDFLPIDDIEPELNRRLRGTPYTPGAIAKSLEGFDAGKYIYNLTTAKLLDLLC